MKIKNIHIIGAGIIGITAALSLQRKGWTVTLIDPESTGSQASKGNAAGIAHTDIVPMASYGVIKDAFKWVFDPVGPLTIRFSHLFQFLPWMVRFIYSARPSAYQQGMKALLALNGMALSSWQRVWEDTNLQDQAVYCGCLEVFGSMKNYQARQKLYAVQQKHHIKIDYLASSNAVRSYEPALGEQVVAGAFLPEWVQVKDPFYLCQQLDRVFLERGGLRLHQNVQGIELDEEKKPVLKFQNGQKLKTNHVLIAGGVYSGKLSKMLKEPVPLESERGYNITIENAGISLKSLLMFSEYGFVISPLSTGIRIGGAVEFAGITAAPNYTRIDRFLTHAKRFLPGLKYQEKDVRWMGHRPSLPDSLPVIGQSQKTPYVFYAFGHGHHGLTQSAITAELITACIEKEKPEIDLHAFRIHRF